MDTERGYELAAGEWGVCPQCSKLIHIERSVKSTLRDMYAVAADGNECTCKPVSLEDVLSNPALEMRLCEALGRVVKLRPERIVRTQPLKHVFFPLPETMSNPPFIVAGTT